nr:hypothetical protein [Burkholderia diffusa]
MPAHFLNKRFHLVIERVLSHLLRCNAAGLDEVSPLVPTDAAARRRQHFLHHVRFVLERRFVLRAAAQLDHLQHVHELLFVRVRVLRAEQRVVSELHFRQRRHDHLRVMLVGKDRQRVAHQRHVVGRADAHRAHGAHILFSVLRRLIAEPERRDARALVLHFLRFVEGAGQIAEDMPAGRLRRVAADGHPGRDTLHRLHLRPCCTNTPFTVGQFAEPTHLIADRRIGRRHARAQIALVLRQVAGVDSGARKLLTQRLDARGLLLMFGGQPRGGLLRLFEIRDHLARRRPERTQ